MRAGFGLVGFLLVIAVIIWIWSSVTIPHSKAVIDTGKRVAPTVNQVAGMSQQGNMKFSDSLKTELVNVNSRPNSILVTEVVTGGPADTYYGLKRGDSITEIGQLGPIRGSMVVNSDEDAEAYLVDTYQRLQTLVVIRDGRKLTLPLPRQKVNNAQQQSDAVQQQIDAVQGAGR